MNTYLLDGCMILLLYGSYLTWTNSDKTIKPYSNQTIHPAYAGLIAIVPCSEYFTLKFSFSVCIIVKEATIGSFTDSKAVKLGIGGASFISM